MKPQDIVVLLKLALHEDEPWSYASLGRDLSISASEVHAAVRRATRSGLFDRHLLRVRREAFLEFVLHGVRYVFVPDRGGLVRGFPTAHATAPLSDEIVAEGFPPVWPDPEGPVRGEAVEPLYRTAVAAARKDPALHRGLALIDAIRIGRARERKLAIGHLKKLLAP